MEGVSSMSLASSTGSGSRSLVKTRSAAPNASNACCVAAPRSRRPRNTPRAVGVRLGSKAIHASSGKRARDIAAAAIAGRSLAKNSIRAGDRKRAPSSTTDAIRCVSDN